MAAGRGSPDAPANALTKSRAVGRTALLAGASGLVGGQCLRRLLADAGYSEITALARRPLPTTHRKLRLRIVDFDALADIADFPVADDVFCCLGTTMHRAGSPEAFRRVDFTYVVELARIASERGARQFLLVSALGASPTARVFYSRVKGETEQAVQAVIFEGIQIFRPSALVGARPDRRPAERLALLAGRALAPALVGPLRKYRPIAADRVAAAMMVVAKREPRGVNVFESDRIESLSREA